jgi:hypothetical protein
MPAEGGARPGQARTRPAASARARPLASGMTAYVAMQLAFRLRHGTIRPACGVPRTGRISRGEVLDIGQQVRARTRPATDLLVASFIWGWGTTGYGPRARSGGERMMQIHYHPRGLGPGSKSLSW